MPRIGSRVWGLSPRVRGNRGGGVQRRQGRGSIPACAGEPHRQRGPDHQSRVYPRVCGGTTDVRWRGAMVQGLSPRVRGNHFPILHAVVDRGSIPACAGEPPRAPPSRAGSGVYPRVCGGTGTRCSRSRSSRGLSPRVRGNRRPAHCFRRSPGSIPACAGEPRSAWRSGCASRVYPRVCGGTPMGSASSDSGTGLSPRVRGNRRQARRRQARAGSIPACAGEPKSAFAISFAKRVYPRVCGGTRCK